jgi:hypothetical protein
VDGLKKRISDYFKKEIDTRKDVAEFHLKKAIRAKTYEHKLSYHDRAWHNGVFMVAVLKDIEKDVLKLI